MKGRTSSLYTPAAFAFLLLRASYLLPNVSKPGER